MSRNTANADRYFVTLEIRKVAYEHPTSGWKIAEAQPDAVQAQALPSWLKSGKAVKVTGELGDKLMRGDLIDAVVSVEEHPKFGRQLKAHDVQRTVRADERALMSFLRQFSQVGDVRARAILAAFGGLEGVLDVLDNKPERLTEIDGITQERATVITTQYRDATDRRAALAFAVQYKLPHWVTDRLLRKFGSALVPVIENNPYHAMQAGLDFEDADCLATKMGVSKDDPRRLAAAALYVLQQATQDGHCWSRIEHLFGPQASRSCKDAVKVTKLTIEQFKAGATLASQPTTVRTPRGTEYTVPPSVIVEGDRYFDGASHKAEIDIAAALRRIASSGGPAVATSAE